MEFQAIICCGKGDNLIPFSAARPHGIPKALLPVANKPMVHHVLDWCYTAFSEILVVTDNESWDQIAKYIGEEYIKTKKQRLGTPDEKPINNYIKNDTDKNNKSGIADFGKVKVVVPCKNMNSTGNILQSLYQNNQITKNFVILPCDFITDLPAEILIEEYRNFNNADTLAMSVCYENNNFIDDIKKTTSFKKLYTCYSHDDCGDLCLLDSYSQASVFKNKFLNVRTQMCWRYPQVNVSATLMDAFIFFCSFKLLKVLSAEFNLEADSAEESFLDYEYEYKTISKIVRDLARRSWQHATEKEKIQMFILPKECVFARCNNLPVYMECNRYLMNQLHLQNVQKGIYQVAHKFIYPSATIASDHDVADSSSTASSTPTPVATSSAGILVESTMSMKGMPSIGPESILGTNCRLDERTNVKKSLIHNNAIVGKRCKITGCVIFPNVVIQDDVVLENCIVGHNVTVESKCRLLNCNVESTYTVARGSNIKGETLLTINIGDEDEDDDDDDDDEDEDYDDEDDSDINGFEFDDDLEGDFFDH